MIAAAGLIAALALGPTGTRAVPIGLWMLAEAVFGVLFCLKLHERALFHETRARAFRARLAELASIDVAQLQRDAEDGHHRRHQHLASLRLNSVLELRISQLVCLGHSLWRSRFAEPCNTVRCL
jgi:hypothetical protein